jgi:membrane protease YdiL (CAAX protease family)
MTSQRSVGDFVRKFTIEQWAAIDRDYIDRSLPPRRAMAILLCTALGLILPHYYGRQRFINGFEGAVRVFKSWPQPDLYPELYWAAFKLINYFLVPALCIRFVLKERIVDHGLKLKTQPGAWTLYLAMLGCMLPIVYGVSFTDAFLHTYPKYDNAHRSLWGLAAWELAYGLQFFLLEFFFRGFLIFSLARHIGSLAVFVMVVPYAMIHFGKPAAECFGSVLAGLLLGTIALRTRSIYGGVLVHCGVGWSMDLFALAQKGQLAKLLS